MRGCNFSLSLSGPVSYSHRRDTHEDEGEREREATQLTYVSHGVKRLTLDEKDAAAAVKSILSDNARRSSVYYILRALLLWLSRCLIVGLTTAMIGRLN